MCACTSIRQPTVYLHAAGTTHACAPARLPQTGWCRRGGGGMPHRRSKRAASGTQAGSSAGACFASQQESASAAAAGRGPSAPRSACTTWLETQALGRVMLLKRQRQQLLSTQAGHVVRRQPAAAAVAAAAAADEGQGSTRGQAGGVCAATASSGRGGGRRCRQEPAQQAVMQPRHGRHASPAELEQVCQQLPEGLRAITRNSQCRLHWIACKGHCHFH